jgi:RimJ/RimL family protein N-acetyltransferase
MEIITKRFLIRDFTEADESALLAYHSDPRYAECCSPEEVSRESTRKLLNLFMQWATEIPRRNYQLAITELESPRKLLGCCGLRCEGYNLGQAELGIELALEYWGRYRYAIEVAGALLEFGFHDLALQEVRGISIDANARVTKLAHRYGFAVVGTRSESDWTRAKGWSQTEWQLTRETWESISPIK